MQTDRRMRLLRRQAIISFIEGFIIFAILLLVIITRNPDAMNRAIPYTRTPGHIIVQLAELPEPIGAGSRMHTGQEWVLYGDGTLLFRKDPADDLWQAHLSPGAVQSMLDVIINQNQFFATREQRYGTLTQGSDENELRLSVDANGQQKEVAVTRKPIANDVPNMQRTHLFLIEQFLLAYHPSDAVFYAPNSDPDGDNGNSSSEKPFKAGGISGCLGIRDMNPVIEEAQPPSRYRYIWRAGHHGEREDHESA